ncbi:MAG TPA: hypothetical protein VF791_12980 [Pyrinomonadaceae bacterium]
MRLEKEHLTDEQVADFRRRALTIPERGRLDAHVAVCDVCLQRLLEPAHRDLAFTSLTEAFMPSVDETPFHLSLEELKRYQGEDLDEADRTIFESHLMICSECSEAADALRSAAGPLPVTSHRDASVVSAAKAGGWSSWRHLWTWTPARAVAAVTIIGCIVLILTLWIRQRPAQIEEQAARIEQSNPAAPLPAGEAASGNESASNEVNRDSSNNSTAGREASAAIIRLKDGDGEVSLDAQGNLGGLEQLSPQIRQAVQTALASERLPEPPILTELTGPKISLMDASSDGLPFNLMSPVRAVISTNRPTLRWQPLAGATGYTVSVFDSNFNLVAKSDPQSATRWTVPLALKNGKVYSWEVTALKGGQEIVSPVAPAPRAQFKVLEAARLTEIASARKQRPLSHLTLGVLYARSGLLLEAEREFRALLKDNPQSPVAKKLLSTVQSWQGRKS